ncbi:hypothetical protein K1T71_009162 [Dendrolimus kikuchii]|uniref:Uncharacterized protein n=1 Tax=Dendrolimus kikuchii TaxID=765133 RepID=A0ACC1CTN3_9NEOP|nr:hypothetical protein K1T71_009162 [Dendrolimus kikuchii]
MAVSSYGVDGVVYNFGEDFNRTLTRCQSGSSWIPLEYSDVGVKGPYENEKGIRASENSCATTLPITLVPEANLYITVFMATEEDESGLLVLVTDENSLPLIKYMYNRSVKEYVAGWCRLSFIIKEESVGYINLFGYSGHNEVILVDSIHYIPKTKNIFVNDVDEDEYIGYDIGNNNTDEIFIYGYGSGITGEEDNYPTEDSGNGQQTEKNVEELDDINDDGSGLGNDGEIDVDKDADDSEESSGEGNVTTTELVTEITTTSTELPVITNPPEEIVESAGLGPWVITLIVVATVTGLALVAIGAYHLGKNKGLSENPLIFDDIQEPRSAVSIPRVRGVAESPIQIIDRPYFM